VTVALQAQLRVRRGDFELDAQLRLQRGEILALLGPNGSGKSTLLGALAGLIALECGTVAVAGRTISDTDRGLAVPPEHRGVGLLGQDPLLFPHLSAIDNVAFGRQSQGFRRTDARAEAEGWLSAVGLRGFENRRPSQLSGGQQQRVAIARALAAQPQVLLLDEPLAAVDVPTASLLRQLLRERLAATGTAAILVTHDVLDAIVVADRVAILQHGRIVDEGPSAQVLGAPSTQFIAALAGVNLVNGTATRDGAMQLAGGRLLHGRFAGSPPPAGTPLAAVFRPSAVEVQPHPATGNLGRPANGWDDTIASLEPSAGGIRIRFVGDPQIVAEVSPLEVAEHALTQGSRVQLAVAAAEVALHRRTATAAP
jgi:molybdate transport system ATP-binding protein